MFIGQETRDWAEEVCRERGMETQNEPNTLPVPERNFGVLQRMMRSDLWLKLMPLPASGHGAPHKPAGFSTSYPHVHWIRRNPRMHSRPATPRRST